MIPLLLWPLWNYSFGHLEVKPINLTRSKGLIVVITSKKWVVTSTVTALLFAFNYGRMYVDLWSRVLCISTGEHMAHVTFAGQNHLYQCFIMLFHLFTTQKHLKNTMKNGWTKIDKNEWSATSHLFFLFSTLFKFVKLFVLSKIITKIK